MEQTPVRIRGFALIVVLSTLSIIALLFASASDIAIGRLSEVRTDLTVAKNAAAGANLMTLAAQVYTDVPGRLPRDQPLPVTWRDAPAQLVLQDAAGRIDLNTANPAMLERLADALGLTPDQLERYRRWRRSPLRLQRVSDFARVTGAPAEAITTLMQVATVFSGRPGVAVETAPIEVLELLSGRAGERADMIRAVPQDWVSPASGANYHVVLRPADGKPVFLGVVSFGRAGSGLILHRY